MKIIAHRGASGEFPENTLLAFEQAIVQQCDGIELDVQYHHSGELILLHDYYLDKTTNGQGKINRYTIEQLQALDAGNGESIPTLAQALKIINGRCLVNIEVKSSITDIGSLDKIIPALTHCVEQAIKENSFLWSHFIISSFNHPLLNEIKQQAPKFNTAALIASYPQNLCQFAEKLNVISVNPSIEIVNKALVKDAHQRGFKVWVYTVDKAEDIAACIDMKVDGIFTNYPKRSKKHLHIYN
jgi:glycerophosphoryl diester phosphodiesterase